MRKKSLGSRSGGGDEAENEINLTPMLDVVFIMLIFFIVTATFIREAGVEVNRPDATTADQQEQVNILVAVTADNEIWMEGRRVDRRAVRSVIERLHAENPQGSVVVQADKGSNTETVVSVIDAARAVGVVDVSLATEDD